MKNIASLVVLVFAVLSLSAQSSPSIVFRVVNGAHKPIRYIKPLDGRYLIGFPEEDTLDAKGELVFPNKERVPAAYVIFYKKTYRLYVQPGKSYVVTVDESNIQAPVTVEGPDKEGQVALAHLQFDFYQNRGMRYYRLDTLFSHNKTRVQKELDSCLLPFRTLYAQRKIDLAFFTYAGHLIRNYYATVLATTLMEPTRRIEFNKDSTRYNPMVIRGTHMHWKEVLAMSDLFSVPSTATDTYFDYSRVMTSWYFSYFIPQSQGSFKQKKTEDEAQQTIYNVLLENYTKEPLREYQLATLLRELTLEDRYQAVIPALFQDFTGRYPRSVFTPVLAPGVDKVKAFLAKKQSGFSDAQHFVEQYEAIETVDELVARFKGKTVFMDLWATWCGPCKEEFAYSKELAGFLARNKMDLVYVSIDKTAADEQWKTMIKFYNLEGYHIRASDKLNKDIFRVFGKNEVLSIPRYAILKDGKMVVDAAKAPSSKEELYKQLEEFKM